MLQQLELRCPLSSPLGAAYFFRGKEYWKVLDGELEVAPGYPQSTARDWLVCRDLPADPEGMDGEAGAHARGYRFNLSRAKWGATFFRSHKNSAKMQIIMPTHSFYRMSQEIGRAHV